MAEPLLDHLGVDPRGQRERRMRVAQVMEPDAGQPELEYDQQSAEAGELYSAAEFVSWLKPELSDGG